MVSSAPYLLHVLICFVQGLLVGAENVTYWPWQTYKSNSVQPPSLNITKSGPTSPGYLFFDQDGDYAHQTGVFIMDDDNELIWHGASADISAYSAQLLDGQPVLTYFLGISFPEPWGWGYGIIEVLDDSYESIYNVSLTAEQEGFTAVGGLDPANLWSYIDIHEAKITSEGSMLVTAINVTKFDLTSIGGPEDGWIADSLFYEIDVKTNEVLFRWSSLTHLDEIPLEDVVQFYPLDDLGTNQTYPYGYFHINAVDKFQDGSYLISSRFYCSIFKISANGSVEWTLQGRNGGDFRLSPDLSFCYQHDARIRREEDNVVEISLFNNDNDADDLGVNQTTGIFMSVNTETMTATLKKQFADPNDPLYSASQGGLQHIPGDDHVVMGYGSVPSIKEYSPDGECIMTAEFGHSQGYVMSYRAYRLPWVGRPKTPPDVFACRDAHNRTAVYMSWLGATEHRSWKVFSGLGSSNLTWVDRVPRDGFETEAHVSGRPSYVQVEAYGSNGTVLGTSSVVEVASSC